MATNRCRAPHLGLLVANPYRVAYVPIDFANPLLTEHVERIWDQQVRIWIGSLPHLRNELVALAPELGISLDSGQLSDETAQRINDFAPLYDGDNCAYAEDERTAWMLLFEGARMALHHRAALTLAG